MASPSSLHSSDTLRYAFLTPGGTERSEGNGEKKRQKMRSRPSLRSGSDVGPAKGGRMTRVARS